MANKITRTWWGEKFLDALASYMDIGRLKRGRSYSSPHRLLEFDVDVDTVKATVRGNINPYFEVYKEPRYKVRVSLAKIPMNSWKEIANDISNHAAILSQLMLNEMPTDIENIFVSRKLRLLPVGRSDIISKCSCPDYALTCKHVAGVYYKIASLLDRDPLLLFQLRGMQFDKLREILASSDLGKALIDQMDTENIEVEYQSHRYPAPVIESLGKVSLKSFWQGSGALPEVDQSQDKPVAPAALIKRGGDFPGFWHNNSSLIEIMEPIYIRIVGKNRHSI